MKKEEYINLLMQLIETQSFSKEEDMTADILFHFISGKGIETKRDLNNIWALNKYYDANKPTLLLNSHHDTVKPNAAYTKNPFEAEVTDGKLYGLGSNDAGGALVSLLATFIYFYDKESPINVIFLASAEEEISGMNGVERAIKSLPKVDFAIVGEPTLMELVIAEKGLMVLDCYAEGKAGHAAREGGVNAIYKAMEDIKWFETFAFPKISEMLGKIKMNVTVIEAGNQHNVIPATCKFTVDVRMTDAYTNEEVLEIIKSNVQSEVVPRSTRLQPSGIEKSHPLVRSAVDLKMNLAASPTCSDQALMSWPSVKCGPGDSNRSHIAEEFIYVEEIEKGIDIYIKLIEKLRQGSILP